MTNKRRALRIGVGLAVLVLALVAFQADFALGTLCVLCPVGFLGVSAASGTIAWGLLPYVVVTLLIVVAVGRFFCAWLCPTSLLRNVFGGRNPRGLVGRTGDDPTSKSSEIRTRSCSGCGTKSASNLKYQGIVVAALLVVSFIVKFPVFCLFCPIGLVFGTLWAVNRVFVLLQPGWELIIFPLMLIAEIFLFKKWCSVICPLGFFFGLMTKVRSRLRIGARPRVNQQTCISKEGCTVCATVCPEDIYVADAQSRDIEACTTCLDCVEHCPTKSIAFKATTNPSQAENVDASRNT